MRAWWWAREYPMRATLVLLAAGSIALGMVYAGFYYLDQREWAAAPSCGSLTTGPYTSTQIKVDDPKLACFLKAAVNCQPAVVSNAGSGIGFKEVDSFLVSKTASGCDYKVRWRLTGRLLPIEGSVTCSTLGLAPLGGYEFRECGCDPKQDAGCGWGLPVAVPNCGKTILNPKAALPDSLKCFVDAISKCVPATLEVDSVAASWLGNSRQDYLYVQRLGKDCVVSDEVIFSNNSFYRWYMCKGVESDGKLISASKCTRVDSFNPAVGHPVGNELGPLVIDLGTMTTQPSPPPN